MLRGASLEQLLAAYPRTGVIATACPCLDNVLRVLDVGHARHKINTVGHIFFHQRLLARHSDALEVAIACALDEWALNIGVRVSRTQVRASLKDARVELNMATVARELVRVVAQLRVTVNHAALRQPNTNAGAQVGVVVLEINGRTLGVAACNRQMLVHCPTVHAVILDVLALLCAIVSFEPVGIHKRTGSHLQRFSFAYLSMAYENKT